MSASPFSHDARKPGTCAGAGNAMSRMLRRPGLARELLLIVAIKCAVLLIFKYTLFNSSEASHMTLPPDQVAQAILSVPASSPPASGNHYDQ